jgi:MFS family permease
VRGAGIDEHSLRYEGWRVTAAAGAGAFFSTLAFYTFAVFLRPITEEFGWSRQSVSSAYGAMALAAAGSAPLLGHLIDRLGAARVFVPCAAVSGCAFASLSALTPRLWHLWGVFLVMGVAVAGSSALAYSRVIGGWFDRRRGVAFAALMSAAAVGGIVHPISAEVLMRSAGWRAAYLTLGLLVLAVGLPTIIRFVRERQATSTGAGPGDGSVSAREAFRSRIFWMVVAVFFGGTLASHGAMVHLSALLTDRGVSAGDAAMAVSAMGTATLAGRLLTGWLIDRFLATRVAFALLAVVATGAFLLAGAESWGQGVTGAALIGFGTGGESDVAPYLLSRYFGLRSISTLYGVVWTSVGCAAAVGPTLMARSFDRTGSYEPALLALGTATLCVAALALMLPAYEVTAPVRLPTPVGRRLVRG